jgi:predicted dehydrogenase
VSCAPPAVHRRDVIEAMEAGLDAVTVRAGAWNPPWSNYRGACSSTAVFVMDNGARVLYHGSWCAKGSFCDWNGNWQIECARGTVVYQNGDIRLHSVPKGYAVTKAEAVVAKPRRFEGQRQILNDFMQGVRAKRQPPTNVFDNIRSVAMVFATVKAMRTNRTVNVLDADTLDLIEEGR